MADERRDDVPALPIAAPDPPLWFRVCANLPRGRYRLLRWLHERGLLERDVQVPFRGGRVVVSLAHCADGTYRDYSTYQIARISRFAATCDAFLGSFAFVGCGANHGIFAVQFAAHARGLAKLVAIEPNPRLFRLLQTNLRNITRATVECRNAAVADFEGKGRLVVPSYNDSTDAWYLAKDPDGTIPVITLASVLQQLGSSRVAIKVDVEGQEVPVLYGARAEIRALERAVLFVEFHRKVLSRIGMTDTEMLDRIQGIRDFSWVNAANGAPIDASRGILAQTGEQQSDLIGLTR